MPTRAFRSSVRLRAQDLKRVLHAGSSLQMEWFTLKVLRLRKEGPPRFGCTVGRRAYPPGVTRNRMKRWFREAFRLHQKEFPHGCDMLVIVKGRPGEESFFSVEKMLLLAASQLRQHPSS